jgi:hypothetical protein
MSVKINLNETSNLKKFHEKKSHAYFFMFFSIVTSNKNRNTLKRRLFCANEVFQSVLMHVRMLCERASGSRYGVGDGQGSIIMIKYNDRLTYSLEEFCTQQQNQIGHALKQLTSFKETAMELIYDSCIVSSLHVF